MAGISVVATISALKAVTSMASGDVAIVRGYYGDADGGSGEFVYQGITRATTKVTLAQGGGVRSLSRQQQSRTASKPADRFRLAA
jgi:hypothetical protein